MHPHSEGLTCVACTATIASGRLCRNCLWGFGSAADHIPAGVLRLLGDLAGRPYAGTGPGGSSLELLGEAGVTVARLSHMGGGGEGGRAAERPLPLNAGVLEACYDATEVLVGWWRIWAAESGTAIRANVMRRAAADLIDAALWIASHDAADELVADVRRVHRQLLVCVDRPAPRHYLGPCGSVDLDGKPCPGELWAGGESVRCRVCGALHATDERRTWLDSLVRDPDRLYSVRDLAWALGHPNTDRIRQWIARGRLVSKGTSQGRALYSYGDAESLNVVPRRQA